jgi:hypothetical protein
VIMRAGLPSASYESYMRVVKAGKIARVMRDHTALYGVSFAAIPPHGSEERADIENLAGVQPASEITWGLALLFYDDMITAVAEAAEAAGPTVTWPTTGKMTFTPKPAKLTAPTTKIPISGDPPPPVPF